MKRFHYAWVICGACTLLMICNMGLCSNILTVYLPFVEDNGISGSQGSAILSIRCLFSFLSVFFVSYYYKRISLRVGVGIATVLGALAALLFSVSTSAAMYFAAAAVAGIAYGLGSTIPMSLLITNWFESRRGLAMGICSAGSGMATVFFSPVLTALAKHVSLRAAFLFQALFMLLAAALLYVLLRETPARMGLRPYGSDSSCETTVRHTGSSDLTVAGWLLMIPSILVVGGTGQASCGHLSILTTTSGYSAETAAAGASLFGLTLVLSKFLFGGIADRIGTKKTSVLFFGIFAAGCLMALLLDGRSLLLSYLLSGVLGFGSPIFAVGVPLWASELSTAGSYERTLKWFQILYAAGGIVFSAIPGMIGDRTGEYVSSFVLFAVVALISLALLLLTYRLSDRANSETAAAAHPSAGEEQLAA